MQTQTRITFLLFLISALFLNGLIFFNRYENKQLELLENDKIEEKDTFFDKFLREEGKYLELFAYDFSNRDDMVRFVSAPETEEIAIDGFLQSFNVSSVWIYDIRRNLVYATNSTGADDLKDLKLPDEFFTTLAPRNFFLHFFIDTPRGFMEIQSAPVQPAWDTERRTPPAGVFLAGRLWSKNYVQELSIITETTIELLPIKGKEVQEKGYDREKGIIQFSRVKRGWDKRPLLEIKIQSQSPLTQQLHRSSNNLLILMAVFVSLVVILLSVLLMIWVNMPLKKISTGLKNENPEIIHGLQKSSTEFGNLATLILRFFHQKEVLTTEINERLKAEKALRIALTESQRSEEETAALLLASRAVLEYHDFHDASRVIINSCLHLSKAATGFIAEIQENDAGAKQLLFIALQADRTAAEKSSMPLKGIFKETYTSEKPVFCNEWKTSPYSDNLPESHTSISSLLCSPLTIKGETAALLVIANKQGGFTEGDVRMATAFSELASVALLNSKTLESLENSEERFRSVVQTARDAIISVNNRGSIVFWNRGAETIFGYSGDEAINKPASFLLAERLRGEYEKSATRLSESGLSALPHKPIETIGLKKSGNEFPMELSESKWKSREGEFFTAIARDITERKEAEEEVRKSEKRLRDIVENSLTGVCIIQADRVVYKNQEFTRLFGQIPAAFALHTYENIHQEDREKVRTFHTTIVSGKGATHYVDFRFYPSGKMDSSTDMRWVNCCGTLIEYQGREALFVNMMDITRFMELEQLVRIQDKMASLGRVAAGIAHEIRNPLTGINSYLYSLKNCFKNGHLAEQMPETVNHSMGAIETASHKIEAVIRRVMDFSKPSRPKKVLVDINDCIDNVLTLSSVTLRKSGITVEKHLAEALPSCSADFHMIEQVLLNLINNAVQAMTENDERRILMIRSLQRGDTAVIIVADSGPGISPENRYKIFDPFYTTKADGSGIGLSLCHRIINDHGGTLHVSTSTFGGAEFTIELPFKKRGDERQQKHQAVVISSSQE